MKTDDITLNVSIDDLKNTIEELENGNGKFLYIMDNLFLIENICTCLHVKQTMKWFNHEQASFKFSYNDNNMRNMIMIKFNFEHNSCYAFLKESKSIGEDQLKIINDKVMKTLKQAKIINIYDSVEKANSMLYNEALMIMTSAINKDDFDLIKSDFDSKYEAWKKRKNDLNEEGVRLINELYNILLKIKLNEKL